MKWPAGLDVQGWAWLRELWDVYSVDDYAAIFGGCEQTDGNLAEHKHRPWTHANGVH